MFLLIITHMRNKRLNSGRLMTFGLKTKVSRVIDLCTVNWFSTNTAIVTTRGHSVQFFGVHGKNSSQNRNILQL